MVQGIYFDQETRSFSLIESTEVYTNMQEFTALKAAFNNLTPKQKAKYGSAAAYAKAMNGEATMARNLMKHEGHLTTADVAKLPKGGEVRNSVAESLKASRANKGSVKVHPSAASTALKAKMNVMSPKGKAVMAGVAGTAALGATAYGVHKLVQKRKEKKAAAKAE